MRKRVSSLNITADLYAAVAALAATEGKTKTAILEAAIAMYAAAQTPPPAVCLGYIQIARPGDADTQTCLTCDQPAAPAWLAVMAGSDGPAHLLGPYCSTCASSD